MRTKTTHPFGADVPTAFIALAIDLGGIADIHNANRYYFERRDDAICIRATIRKTAMGVAIS